MPFSRACISVNCRGEEVIGAMVAGEEESAALQTSAGSALLVIRETSCDTQNVAIEFRFSLLRGDRYTASVISVRKNWCRYAFGERGMLRVRISSRHNAAAVLLRVGRTFVGWPGCSDL